ncbi:hypothetical protein EYF80_021532 [Liparis tanakae]|uniref:Uncharacterized protein n=1 Tax=Liparis tanakae TaxID=230148 RepID=A0A4Z2HRG5_9TELE|nr:hypothetical protein EYF80_021532 [Liparis tanakae]
MKSDGGAETWLILAVSKAVERPCKCLTYSSNHCGEASGCADRFARPGLGGEVKGDAGALPIEEL